MMELNMNRRTFLKTAGAASLAVAASSLLGGCSGGELVETGTGLNNTIDLRGVQMTVRSLAYVNYSSGVFYMLPEIQIRNETAAGIPVKPTGGSFKLLVNGTNELTIDADTMAILDKNRDLTAMKSRTLSRGQSERGYLCAKGSGVSKFSYVQIIYYPNPSDAKTYLSCRVYAREASPMLGI